MIFHKKSLFMPPPSPFPRILRGRRQFRRFVNPCQYGFSLFRKCIEERQRLLLNHRHQLATHIRYLATQAPDRHLTHVADREFDDVLAMAAAREVGAGFVFRCLGNRNVRLETGEDVDMASLIASLPMRPYKSLGLDARGHVAYGKNRPKRVASLSIGACRVFFFRPCTRGERRNITLEEPLGVHLVVIRELEAPDGEKPLCWLLFTSLPIDTQERQARAAAYYEQRWRIEPKNAS